MEVLKTINEVWAFNLRRFRAKRTQSDIAEAVGMSLRGYQHLETGALPKSQGTTAIIAKVLGVSESRLFADPDEVPKPSAKEALKIVEDALKASELRPAIRRLLDAAASLNDSDVARYAAMIEAHAATTNGENAQKPAKKAQKLPGEG